MSVEPSNRRVEGEYTFWDCPDCGAPICTWTDCPECGWYDDVAWNRAIVSQDLDLSLGSEPRGDSE